jgi:hypothetical protein
MKDLLRKALGILKVELEDLEEDIEDLLKLCQRRMDQREITNYVYQENKGLLLREIAGVKSLVQGLDTLDVRRFASAKGLFQEIDRQIREKTREGGHPEAVYSLVKRRLDKVAKYLGD